MQTGLIIGLIIGIGVGVSLYFVLRGLGYFQYLGGQRRSSIPPVNKEMLVDRLLDLNELSKPYCITRGKDTDLLAEWKLVDATWYGVFSKSHVGQSYRISLLIDEPRHTVRYYEETGSVSWVQGNDGLMPLITYQKKLWPIRKLSRKEKGMAYTIKDPESFKSGKVYEYQFDIANIREPLATVVRESGWEWVPVTARRHVTYRLKEP